MNFDKASLNKLLKLSDDELIAVVKDIAREAGVEEGDTVSIYDFEFDFVY